MFKSTAFNTKQPRDYFINPNCFGDDVALWLISQLRQRGFQADDEPGQEDFGWYIYYHAGGKEYCFLIRYQPGESSGPGDWIGTIERVSGVNAVSFFLGAPKRRIELAAAHAIHDVLSSSKEVSDIRWFLDKAFLTRQGARPKPFEG